MPPSDDRGRVGNRGRAPGKRARFSVHEGLVGARELIGTPYLADPVLRAEYERDIAPRTRLALAKILSEVFPRPLGPGRPRRALDLGAGTGAAGATLRAHFGDDLELLGVDRVPGAATAGAGRDGGGPVRAGDVTDVPALSRVAASSGPFDLAVAAHVLNELDVERGGGPDRVARLGRLVAAWCEVILGERGMLILLEPALRETSRALLAVRDHLVAGGLEVVAPCFFAGPCPALLRGRDWCHDSVAARAGAGRGGPGGGGGGGSRSRVDFSYLVVRRAAVGATAADPALCRIVSDPLPEKGRLKLFACGAEGRHPLVRLDRHASASNAAMDKLVRGDVARVIGVAVAGDGMRVLEETTVTRR